MSQGFTRGTPIDTDPTLSLNSDIVVPSQAAVVAYVASQVGTPVTNVTASAPILSSGGLTPNISIPAASALVDGYLTLTDWSAFNAKIGGSGTTNQIAYFTAASTLGSLTTATYPNLTELSYVKGVTSAIQTQINNLNSYVLAPFKSNTDIVHTGTTAETKVFSQLITAGTIAANDMIDYVIKYTPSATATAKVIKVYFNTSDSLTGANLFATYGASVAATRYAGFQRKIIFKNSLSSQQILLSTQSTVINEDTTTVVASELKTQNFAVNQYFIVSVTLTGSAADTVTINSILSKTYR